MRHALLPLALLLLAPACGDGGDGGDDGGGPQAPDPRVIPLEEARWTWVPFEAARCMNGTSTGIGVYRSPGATRLLVYLAPGGACFNAETCAQVAHPDGYGQEQFRLEVLLAGSLGVFSRSAPDNPFRDWNVAYVPYCTGDVHAGRNPAGPGGRVHVGYENLGLYLERLVPTFADATTVVLAGSSAGGLGATLNYDRVQRAFGSVPVHLLDDSGPMFDASFLRPCLQQQWREAWALDAAFPADCTECTGPQGDFVNLFGFLARKYPERRFGLICSTQDESFRYYFGFSDRGDDADCRTSEPLTGERFEQGLTALRARLAGTPNLRFFSPAGTKHVYTLDRSLSATQVQGVSLATWLRGLAEGSADWGDAVAAGGARLTPSGPAARWAWAAQGAAARTPRGR